jgi:hypothetical protein
VTLRRVLPGVLLLAVLAARPSSQAVSRIDRLEQWMAAIERHEPGTFDPPAMTVRPWNSNDMRWLWIDLNSVIRLMRDPGVSLFFMTTPGQSTPTRYVYSGSDLRRLLTLALKEIPRRNETGVQRQDRARVSQNRLLKRGAVLHGDIAMLAEPQSAPADRRPDPSGSIRVQFMDGRRVGTDYIPSHWQTARTLLDAVPVPSRDEMVNLWYRATNAQLQATFQINPTHNRRALELFPDDADLLFFAGCYHEVMATSQVQNVSRALPQEMTGVIGSERSELRQAERFFRRALSAASHFDEARIRLGRVLGLLGRHADAVDQLRAAAPADPLLAYYAAMFLGAEVDALARPAEARGWYERAAALYPSAQSPLLALSQLAQREADRPGAIRTLEQALQFRADGDDDPWWTYHTSQGRDVDTRLRAMYRAVPPGEAR